jgi:polyisoprenoid-binding protein YceI
MTAVAARTVVGGTVWQVDTIASTAHFSVRNFGVKRVRGQVALVDGEAVLGPDGGVLSLRGQVEAAGIDTGNARRDTDLRGAKLLSVATAPTWTFESREVRRDGDEWHVTGRLTVRDSCDVTWRVSGVEDVAPGVVRVSATASLDRRDAGVRAPRVLIGQQVDVELQVVLRRSA